LVALRRVKGVCYLDWLEQRMQGENPPVQFDLRKVRGLLTW